MTKQQEVEALVKRLEGYKDEGLESVAADSQIIADVGQAAAILKQVLEVAKVLCGFLQ